MQTLVSYKDTADLCLYLTRSYGGIPIRMVSSLRSCWAVNSQLQLPALYSFIIPSSTKEQYESEVMMI